MEKPALPALSLSIRRLGLPEPAMNLHLNLHLMKIGWFRIRGGGLCVKCGGL